MMSEGAVSWAKIVGLGGTLKLSSTTIFGCNTILMCSKISPVCRSLVGGKLLPKKGQVIAVGLCEEGCMLQISRRWPNGSALAMAHPYRIRPAAKFCKKASYLDFEFVDACEKASEGCCYTRFEAEPLNEAGIACGRLS